MDIDDLSNEAYEAVIGESEDFNNSLSLQFESLAYGCETEEEYLSKSLELIDVMNLANKEVLSSIFFDVPPAESELKEILKKIASSIKKMSQIPEDKRTYEF